MQMQLENESPLPAILCSGIPEVEETGMVGEQLLDFLDGRTHGEDLLHELYDHVLEEPIPQRMRALLK